MKIEIAETEKNKKVQVKHLESGTVFYRAGNSTPFMKLKPTSFLLNSEIITDVLNRADALVCNVILGTCFPIKGTEYVTEIDTTLMIHTPED